MANELKFDGQYGGLGICASRADSNDTTISASPGLAVATFPLVGGQQPPVSRGKIYVEGKALNVAAIPGAVDLWASDGTNLEYLDAIPAPASATAGQGFSYVREFYTSQAKVTNVVSVTARVVLTTNANGTIRCRVLGGP